jgi:PIN domain nuclease of toxin-antitoxin system
VAVLPDGVLLADASYLLAIAQANPLATRFVSALKRTTVTSVNLGEVMYKLAERARRPPQQVVATFGALGVTVAPLELRAAMRFPELKRVDAASRAEQEANGTGRVKSLSLGDMCCLAHALERGLPVLTGDQHWLALGAHGLTLQIFDFSDPALTL